MKSESALSSAARPKKIRLNPWRNVGESLGRKLPKKLTTGITHSFLSEKVELDGESYRHGQSLLGIKTMKLLSLCSNPDGQSSFFPLTVAQHCCS